MNRSPRACFFGSGETFEIIITALAQPVPIHVCGSKGMFAEFLSDGDAFGHGLPISMAKFKRENFDGL